MSLFKELMGKIFGTVPTPTSTQSPAPATPGSSQNPPASSIPSSASAATASAPSTAPVDVPAILDGLAAKSSESLDWKTSIVDLLKLVGMDSSLSARKQLATELHYSGDMSDSAAMNVWLHKAVMTKLAENGGKIPQNLL